MTAPDGAAPVATGPSLASVWRGLRRHGRRGLRLGAALQAFCQLTGYDGTTAGPTGRRRPGRWTGPSRSASTPTSRDLPWDFSPADHPDQSRSARPNWPLSRHQHSDKPITGRAVYNVVPEQAGAYFEKLECFCFSDQTIGRARRVEFPVVFFVDPEFATIRDRTEGQVTLSYTFFRVAPSRGRPKLSRAPGPWRTAAAGL